MAPYAGAYLRRLEEAGFELVDGYRPAGTRSVEEMASALKGIWGTVAGSEPYSREILRQATDLRVIARCGVGFDAIDVEAATELGVAILITPDANSESVADFALTLMLACLRQLIPVDRAVRSGRWRSRGLSADLAGATVGIVGLGRIGRAVARRLRGFNCRILGVDPLVDLAACRELGVELMTLDEMLPQVDVLTIHAPRLPETSNLIGAPELARMKSTAVLVNTARGGIVDETALLQALDAGTLAGAGLDVYEQEPLPLDHPLILRSDVVLGGHVSAFTRLAMEKTMEMVVAGILDVAAGRVPEGCINPPALAQRQTISETSIPS
jgi:D-3-phosphoglycerate dehydrogenase/(S)-sulfolactate dehydrogenase